MKEIYLLNVFNELLKEFGLNDEICQLCVVNRLEFINETYDCRYYRCESVDDLMDSINYSNQYFDGSKIFNFYDEDEEGNIVYRIFINKEWLSEFNGVNFDELMEFLTLSLRHEIGHVLYDMYMFDQLGLEEGNKALNYSSDRASSAYIDFYNELIDKYYESDDETDDDIQRQLVSKYYSMKIEKMANKFGKVDTRKLIKLTLKYRPLAL